MHVVRPGLRAALEALRGAGHRGEFDLGAAGSHGCRIQGPGGAVSAAGASVDEAAAGALRPWVRARRQG